MKSLQLPVRLARPNSWVANLRLTTSAAVLIVLVRFVSAQPLPPASEPGKLASSSMQIARDRFQSKAPVEASELSFILDSLKSPDYELRRLALHFLAERQEDIRDAISDKCSEISEMGEQEINAWNARLCNALREFVAAVDQSADCHDLSTQKEAIRTLCALRMPAFFVCPPRGRCGNGIYWTFEGYSSDPLHKRAKENRLVLLALIQDTNPTVVLNAALNLPKEDTRASQPQIRKLLASKDKQLRAVAIYLLEPESDQDVIGTFGPLMGDAEEDLRECALAKFVDTLKDPVGAFRHRMTWSAWVRKGIAERIGNDENLANREPMLLTLLSDPSGIVRAQALLHVITDHEDGGSPVSEGQMRDFFHDENGQVRSLALGDLCRRKVRDADALVRAGLADPSRTVRTTAALRCNEEGPLVTGLALNAFLMGIDDDWSIMSLLSDPANDHLVDGWLSSSNARLRDIVVRSMNCREEPTRCLPRLLKLTHDPDSGVLSKVLSGLAACKTPEAIDAILEVARRCSAETLADCITALDCANDPRAIPFLKQAAASSDPKVRKMAKSALRHLKAGEADPKD